MASSPTDMEGVDPRIDELQRRVDGLVAALAAGRRTRLLMMLVFVAFVVVSCWSFYTLAGTIQTERYKAQLLEALQKSLESNKDVLAGEAQKLSQELAPVISTALTEQSKKDMPLYMKALDHEQQTLVAELPDMLVAKVEERHHELLQQQEKLFEEEFPAARDPQIRNRVIANVDVALNRLIQKYYAEEFKKSLASMSKTWDEFTPAPTPEEGDAPLEDQLLGELMDLMALKVTRDPLADATP